LKLEKSISYNSARDSYGGAIEATIKPRKRSQNNFVVMRLLFSILNAKK
jgi:predicted outer membrane repeat protein